MTMPRATWGAVRFASHRVVAITVMLLALLVPKGARADNVDQLIAQLSDSSDKVRLSATLNLTKLGAPRAIPALSDRLTNDSNADVRRVAAVGLGSLVTDKVKGSPRSGAISALTTAAQNDPSPAVQAQSQRALQAIGATTPQSPP